MKKLDVPFLGINIKSPDEMDSLLTERAALHEITVAPWPEYGYIPQTSFRIGWTQKSLLLKFSVKENVTKAELTKTNDMVCNDSCVEFFVEPGDGTYINIEVNPIGTVYAARGKSRETSIPFVKERAEEIRCFSSLGHHPFPENKGMERWSVLLEIPLDFFRGTSLACPSGKSFRANFYKCGDELSQPHYTVWNRIETPSPDYHRPEYFGELYFEPIP